MEVIFNQGPNTDSIYGGRLKLILSYGFVCLPEKYHCLGPISHYSTQTKTAATWERFKNGYNLMMRGVCRREGGEGSVCVCVGGGGGVFRALVQEGRMEMASVQDESLWGLSIDYEMWWSPFTFRHREFSLTLPWALNLGAYNVNGLQNVRLLTAVGFFFFFFYFFHNPPTTTCLILQLFTS